MADTVTISCGVPKMLSLTRKLVFSAACAQVSTGPYTCHADGVSAARNLHRQSRTSAVPEPAALPEARVHAGSTLCLCAGGPQES